MLQLLRTLFGRAPARSELALRSVLHPLQARAPSYDADLVAQLLQAQHALELRLQSLLACYRARDLGTYWYELEQCDRELAVYLVAEGMRFEVYMRHVLAPDAEALRLMRRLRVRLRAASRGVHGLAESNHPRQMSPHAIALLGEQLGEIDADLRQCFQVLERQLFPLYQPIRRETEAAAAGRDGSA